MKYFQVIYYKEGNEYETHEKIVDEGMHWACLQAMKENGRIIFPDGTVMRASMIKEINHANDIIKEYTDIGIPLEKLAIQSAPMPERLKSGGWRKQMEGESGAIKQLS